MRCVSAQPSDFESAGLAEADVRHDEVLFSAFAQLAATAALAKVRGQPTTPNSVCGGVVAAGSLEFFFPLPRR